MDLRDYEQHKFAIADVLRAASVSIPAEQREWHEQAQELFARLAEDRFNLVVVGRFNRGKTCLMNALMGTDRLPMGIVPLTSVITTVAYGSREQVELHYEERILTHKIPIDELAQYVTQEGNPGNVRRIKKAEVQLPAEILRRGFYFVDTPGLGSAIAENTHTTEAYLPEADAFLLVSSYESPLSDDELRFFRSASSSACRIFVVLNKHDLVSAEERCLAAGYVREQLSTVLGAASPSMFSVSARDGLEAKRLRDRTRLVESGLTALENALVDFLLTEKSTAFLLNTLGRTEQLLRDLPSPERPPLVNQVRALAEAIVRETPVDRTRPLPQRPLHGEVQRPRACKICAQINQAVWDFLRRFQYELSIDQERQQDLARRGGLCSFHSWQYEAIASPQGICTGFPPLLDRLAQQFRGAASGEVHASAVQALIPDGRRCVMCAVQAEKEAEAVSHTAEELANNPRSLRSFSGLCLPHLAMLTASIDDQTLAGTLIEREASILERLSEDMKRYALKRDGVRRQLLTEEETAAAQQALLLLVGHRNVNATAHVAAARTGEESVRPNDGGVTDQDTGAPDLAEAPAP